MRVQRALIEPHLKKNFSNECNEDVYMVQYNSTPPRKKMIGVSKSARERDEAAVPGEHSCDDAAGHKH